MIDVIISNLDPDLDSDNNSDNQQKKIVTDVIGCPFSDHKFLIAAFDFNKIKFKPFRTEGRSLSDKNLILITDHISFQDLSVDKKKQIDLSWDEWKGKILNSVNTVAPIKEFKQRPQEIAPWVDEELLEKLRVRDYFYFKFHNSNTSLDSSEYFPKFKQYKACLLYTSPSPRD